MRFLVLCVATFLPFTAQAACEGETYLDCPTADGRRIEACIGSDSFSYRFGTAGDWELELSVPMEAGTVTPWSGMGGSIWSSVGFPNGEYLYEVWASVDRNDETANPEGGVNVMKGEETIVTLDCAPGTANAAAFVLEDAMAERGYCYDLTDFVWRKGDACPVQ